MTPIVDRRSFPPFTGHTDSRRDESTTPYQRRQASSTIPHNVSRRVVLDISQTKPEQAEQRNQYRIHPGFGGADKGARDSHHKAQTRSEFVVERVQIAARSTRRYLSLERNRRRRCRPIGGKIPQLPTRLPPLVRGRFTHPGALELLGKQPERLDETSSSIPNSATRSHAGRETIQGRHSRPQPTKCARAPRHAGHHTADPSHFREFKAPGLDYFSIGHKM